MARTNVWTDVGADPGKTFVVQTATTVIERCILMTTDPGDLVIDPTCGSGTAAYVAEQWGRRWITVDTSRVAMALARQRLMAARYPYYKMADDQGRDIRQGFVYETVPHVTLKSIANNPQIREGMSREQVDAAIARHADQEALYDRPLENRSVVRVTGPFTVESLSPHVTLPESGSGDVDSVDVGPGGDDDRFFRVVLDHLRKAGVQNTVRAERLQFETVQPWPGSYVQAAGEYLEQDRTRRAALSIGPRYGTVDAAWVREAAKEAAGIFDVLIVCGFAFDGYLDPELKRLGGLQILKAAMNPDLSMGDEVLKKTASGNLFMVFGEPDIDVRREADGWVIEIRGLDIYDPTTGDIRSHSTDDIACWFVDTDYNAESFFVRHAYFTGANDPYEQLRRALRADVDQAAWESLYRTVSRPFPPPATGQIAIKVINHYGDEVMKVYPIPIDRELSAPL